MSFIKVVVFRDRLNFFERKCSFLSEKTLLSPFNNRKPTTMKDKNEKEKFVCRNRPDRFEYRNFLRRRRDGVFENT